ncbi:MAG: hypothetical protein HC812_15385 [Leptolyngbya sp. RL_3_1]|nr:hypothetical protein [Leptolyngbya sp. RL_3_1]
MTPTTAPRQARYLALIDQLLACPNGQEPDILDGEPDLLDAEFVQVLMQTARFFAHQDSADQASADAAKFLLFIARELSVQLGLDDQTAPQSSEAWVES